MNDQTKPSVGFVGVGRMGANMALHLIDLGYRVPAVYDVDPAVARRVAASARSKAVSSLPEVTALCDIIITVVSDDAAMHAIFAASGPTLLANASGKIFVNCATISPSVHVDVERRAEAAGAHTIEACMASSIQQAREGTLYLMVAGNRDVFERVRPVLADLSSNLRYIGKAGEAGKLKALVNMVMNINTAGLAEGLGLAEALGLDLTVVRETFAETGAASRVLQTDGADMQNRDHDVYFSAAHAAKDSHIALALAHEADIEVPLCEATATQYDRLVAAGHGNLDKSAIAELTFASRRSRAASSPKPA